MRKHWSVALAGLAIALAVGCAPHGVGVHGSPGKAAAPPAVPPPAYVVLRIDEVRVRATRPNGTSWDDAKVAAVKSNAGCEFLAAAAGFGVGLAYGGAAGGVAAKGMNFLCVDTTPPAQVQQDPKAPDLQLLLSAAGEPAMLSDRVDDVTQHVFRYRMLVPFDAIPGDGLKLEVIDVDADSYESIGFLRLSREDIYATYNSATKLLVRTNIEAIERLELVIEQYNATPPEVVTMNANEGTHNTGRSVLAGEVVMASAKGDYHVSTSFFGANEPLTPAGYPGGGPKGYNYQVEPLRSASHGCGFMAVGNRRRGAALVAPSGGLLAPASGPLIVGVNDDDPGNNAGSLSFFYATRPPTVAEWLARRPL